MITLTPSLLQSSASYLDLRCSYLPDAPPPYSLVDRGATGALPVDMVSPHR